MSDPLVADLFVEDVAHEMFVRALVNRIAREEIRKATRAHLLNPLVTGCPNPHVERWFPADPDSFHQVVVYRPAVGREKCEREHYKRLLVEAVRKANQPAAICASVSRSR